MGTPGPTTTERMAINVEEEAPAVMYGRPLLDFAAAPSIFSHEDIKQEERVLGHRGMLHAKLEQAEKQEASAVQTRRTFDRNASAALAEERHAAAMAAEAAEILRNTVKQRAALEAKFTDAKLAAEQACAAAEEYRKMFELAVDKQQEAQANHAAAAEAAEAAAANSRKAEFAATTARLANDVHFAERAALESQSYRQPAPPSALAGRSPYLMDPAYPAAQPIQNRQRSTRTR